MSSNFSIFIWTILRLMSFCFKKLQVAFLSTKLMIIEVVEHG
jgi:hypothetical protein